MSNKHHRQDLWSLADVGLSQTSEIYKVRPDNSDMSGSLPPANDLIISSALRSTAAVLVGNTILSQLGKSLIIFLYVSQSRIRGLTFQICLSFSVGFLDIYFIGRLAVL